MLYCSLPENPLGGKLSASSGMGQLNPSRIILLNSHSFKRATGEKSVSEKLLLQRRKKVIITLSWENFL
jgi:hypothetical protein